MNIDLEDEVDQYIPSGKSPQKGKINNKKSQKKIKGEKILSGEEIYHLALQKFREKGSTKLYREIIDILNPFVQEHPDHIFAQKMLGYAYVETDAFSDAVYQFQKALSLNRNDVESLNALAYLGLSENKLDQSIEYLLDAIYIDNNNPRLKENLEKLRNIKDPKVFISMTKPTEFIFIDFPKESLSIKISRNIKEYLNLPLFKIGIGFVGLAVLILLIYILYPSYINWMEDYRFKRGLGKGKVSHVTIQDINRLVDERIKYNIKLSDDDVKKKFETIKFYLEEKKRNRSVILINELLNSNASEFIKERVRILENFVPNPDPQQIDYVPAVQEVIRTPFLYQDVDVRWSGTIANLEHKDRKETVFDLLINFVDNAVVEGIAEAHFEGFENIISGEKVAVYGIIAGITVDNKIIVKGKQIQRIGK